MTIEEKLKHFYDTSVDEARRQAEKDVREHKESLDAALEEHKKMSLGNAASSRKAEIANATRWKTPPAPAEPRLQTQSARSTRHFPQSSFTSGVTGLPDRAA